MDKIARNAKKEKLIENIEYLAKTKIDSLDSDILNENAMGFKIASFFVDLECSLNEEYRIESFILDGDNNLSSDISRVMIWNDDKVFTFVYDNRQNKMISSTMKKINVKELNVVYKNYYCNLLEEHYTSSKIDYIEILLEGESDTRFIDKSENAKELLKSLYKSIK